ncbi:MAG: (Fe-S)-binding protein [Anaerolineae bacterium]
MQHAIPVKTLGPQGGTMARAVEACVHCGFCLPACPTYHALGEEMDSPRGRIILMKEALEGNLALADTLPYLDRCLGCQGCLSACPSGVAYGDLLAAFRAYSEERRARGPLGRASRWLIHETLPYPGRFRLALRLGRLARPFHGLAPNAFKPMLDLLPAGIPPAPPLPEIYPAQGKRRARVAMLAVCVQQVLAPQINWATLRVLARNGVETLIPREQGCCGALALHAGEGQRARALAEHNLRAFPEPGAVDAIITNAAGCGSGMREYPLLFRGRPQEAQAQAFARKVKDVSVLLTELGLKPPPPLPQPVRVAYHDACHLLHAQGVEAAPRQLLAQIPNLTLLEIPDGELCCGSAGTYNLEQPDLARQLGERKARHILDTNAGAVATGNIGCLTQIEAHLAALGRPLPLFHTLELLDRSYATAQG